MKRWFFLVMLITITVSTVYGTKSNITSSDNLTLHEDKIGLIQQKHENLQELKPKTIQNMTQDDLKNFIDSETNNVIVTLWKTTEITEAFATLHTVLGFLLGFFGAMSIEFAREERGKRSIRRLLREDILRIHGNVQQNLDLCRRIVRDTGTQHEFLNRIRIIPDLENLQELGASQQFNFWQTIISSTQLVLLRPNQISNVQFVYDASRTYNNAIEAMINGINSTNSPYVIVGGKQDLAQKILVTRNIHQAHKTLTDLCTGLITIHEGFLRITMAALLSLHVKETEIPHSG